VVLLGYKFKQEGLKMKKANAMIHSLKEVREVTIISENGNNNVIAEYNGVKCTAVFNPFVGLYYVDDIYGIIAQ
jgi:hypothetical protein